MKKAKEKILPMLSMAALAMCVGCASISTTDRGMLNGVVVKGTDGVPVEHVWLGTSGEYVFWSIPLGSGEFYWDEHARKLDTRTAWFRDCVGISELQEALLKYAESRNCDVAEVSYFDSDTSYAGVSYEGIIGILFGSSNMGVSAVLVPRKNAVNK